MKKTSLILILIILFIPIGVFAEENAGNYFESNSNSTDNLTGDISRDAYLFARTSNVNDANIGRSLLNFSYVANISNSTIGDSVRSLSESLTISDSKIDNNLTVVARDMQIKGNSTYNALYGVAGTATVGGNTNSISMAGESITITGTVNGDVNLRAANIVIKSGADIKGNLNITSGKKPIIEDGAKVGKTNFDQIKPRVHEKSPVERLTETLIDILYWSVVTLIIAYLFVIFAGNSISSAVNKLKKQTLAMILSGIISFILIPVLSLILILPYITLPITFMVLTIYFLIIAVSIPFAAVVLGQLALPKLNKWLSTLIFGLILGILSRIPYLSIVVNIICIVITFGYIILKLYENMLKAFRNKNNENNQVYNSEDLYSKTNNQ